jgi:hypothetical protein
MQDVRGANEWLEYRRYTIEASGLNRVITATHTQFGYLCHALKRPRREHPNFHADFIYSPEYQLVFTLSKM